MKIYIIHSRWAWSDQDEPTDHEKCFIRAGSPRDAERLFRKGFNLDAGNLVDVRVEELTWEMFNELAPDEFMLNDTIEF